MPLTLLAETTDLDVNGVTHFEVWSCNSSMKRNVMADQPCSQIRQQECSFILIIQLGVESGT